MLSWSRWYIRLAVVYLTSAVSLMLAVQIELTAVGLHWVDAWLDTPMFFDLQGLLAVAIPYPIVVAPFFVLAEVEKQIQKRPMPPPAYIVFTMIYTMISFAMYDFSQVVAPLFAFIKDDLGRRIVMILTIALFAAGLTALALASVRAMLGAAPQGRRPRTP